MPRRLLGSSTIALSLVVCLAVLGSGAGAASSRPLADTPPYGDKSKTAPGLKGDSKPPTCSTRKSDPALTFNPPLAGGPSPAGDVCGTPHDDSLKVTDTAGAGTQIWAGPGRDVVNAKNGRIDEIWGGTGSNKATIDWCLPDGKIHDGTHDIAKLTKVKVNCTGVTQSRRFRSGAAVTYPYDEPYISCTVSTTGKRLMSITREPVVNAVDATANVDWQTVAFSALLYEWNGTEYEYSQQSDWVWDRVPDEQLEDFGGNFWRRFGETSHRKIFFNPTSAGRYRIAIRYHWYAANNIEDYDELDWASYHFGHFGSASLGYCNFPGPPPPDGSYTGTSDEGQAISFKAAPIWSSVPRLVGGSRLTEVKYSTSVSCTPARTVTLPINVDPGKWIQLDAYNTFSYARVGGLTSATRQHETASYFLIGKIDTSGKAAGSIYIQELSFDESGTHYACAGVPHSWTAAKTG